LSDFKYKMFSGSTQVVIIKETEKEYLFGLIKALVRHDPIDLSQNWVFTRIAKNVFILTPKRLDEESKKEMEKLGFNV